MMKKRFWLSIFIAFGAGPCVLALLTGCAVSMSPNGVSTVEVPPRLGPAPVKSEKTEAFTPAQKEELERLIQKAVRRALDDAAAKKTDKKK